MIHVWSQQTEDQLTIQLKYHPNGEEVKYDIMRIFKNGREIIFLSISRFNCHFPYRHLHYLVWSTGKVVHLYIYPSYE